MNTIEEKLKYLEVIKEDIQNAIESTGANINDATEFRLYANLIRSQFESIEAVNILLNFLINGSKGE